MEGGGGGGGGLYSPHPYWAALFFFLRGCKCCLCVHNYTEYAVEEPHWCMY